MTFTRRFIRAHQWSLMATVYSLVVMSASIGFGRTSTYSGLFALVPVLLAFEFDWRGVAAGAVSVLLLTFATFIWFHDNSMHTAIIRLFSVIVGCALGMYASIYRVERETALKQTRAVAEAAQTAILPDVPRELEGFGFASHYRSASQEARIGGDFFKVISTPFGTRLIIGDVQGKGMTAIKVSAVMLGCFREWASELADLRDLVGVLDSRVKSHGAGVDFVTAIVATLNDGSMELANCGHPAPVLIRPNASEITRLDPARTTTPLGLSPTPRPQLVQLSPKDRVLFFTDGLTDCTDRQGEFLPMSFLLNDLAGHSDEELLGTVVERLSSRCPHLRDDLALLLVSQRGTAPALPEKKDLRPQSILLAGDGR